MKIASSKPKSCMVHPYQGLKLGQTIFWLETFAGKFCLMSLTLKNFTWRAFAADYEFAYFCSKAESIIKVRNLSSVAAFKVFFGLAAIRRNFDSSDFLFVKFLTCRNFDSSDVLFVKFLTCKNFDLPNFLFVQFLTCRNFDLPNFLFDEFLTCRNFDLPNVLFVEFLTSWKFDWPKCWKLLIYQTW